MLRRIPISRLSVRVRLGLIQLLLLGALLATGLVCWNAISLAQQAGQALALLSRPERLHLNADMMHDALRADVNAALRIAPGNSAMAGEVLASTRENAHRYELDIEQMRLLAVPDDLRKGFTATEPQALAYIAQAQHLVETALRSHDEALALEPGFIAAFEDLLRVNERVTGLLAAQVEDAERRSVEDASLSRNWIIATGVVTALLAWGFVVLISHSIRGSLRQVSEAARALAAGNLSVRSEVASQDEVGELAGALNKMADDLQNMIDRLLSDADRDAFTAQLMQALEMAENERVAQGVVSRAMAQVSADLPMEMLMVEPGQSELHVVAEHPQRGRAGCGVEALDGCVAIRRGGAMVFEDSDALNACPRLRDRPCGPISAVCVPVTFMGHSLGVLHVAGTVRKSPSAKQVAQFAALGVQSGARVGAVRAFARAQLHAYTDPLTGLANRRALEPVIATLQNSQASYAIAMADLDQFKRLNDTHGHDAGDAALKLFAEVLQQHVRHGDKVARWGGEEFALLFPDAGAPQIVDVLERIRSGLAEALLVSGGPAFTASFGLSDSRMAGSFDEVMRLADVALYAAKEQGRDRICVTPEPAPVAERPGSAAG